MIGSNLSRRGALGALIALTTAPAIALPAPADTANALWAQRKTTLSGCRNLPPNTMRRMPSYRLGLCQGSNVLTRTATFAVPIVAGPSQEDLTPPSVGERIVRPSIHQAKENFEFAVRVFGSTPAFRKHCRANMRRNIRAIVAQLRERDRLYTELGLIDLDRAMSDTCTALCESEDKIDALEQSPNVIAASLLAGVNRRSNLTPYRRPILTPLSGGF